VRNFLKLKKIKNRGNTTCPIWTVENTENNKKNCSRVQAVGNAENRGELGPVQVVEELEGEDPNQVNNHELSYEPELNLWIDQNEEIVDRVIHPEDVP
jgi:hypothetical protein